MAKSLTMGAKLTLKKGNGEPNDIVIKSLVSIGRMSGEVEQIDATTLDSKDGAKEYISGAIDWGEQEIEGMIDDVDQVIKLRKMAGDGHVYDWELESPSKLKIVYKAFVKSFTNDEKTVDGIDKFSLTLRLSGDPEFKKVA